MASRPDAVRRFSAVGAVSIAVKLAALALFAYLVLYVLGVHG